MASPQRGLPWLLVAGVLGVAGWLGWRGWSTHGGTLADERAPAVAADPEAIEAARRRSAAQAMPTPSALPPAEAVREQLARIAEQRKQSAARLDRAKRDAAAAFAQEPVDPVWSAATERRIDQVAALPAIQQNSAAPKDMRVECRSSMCRVTSDFTTSGQADDWTMLFMASVGSTLPQSLVSRVTNPDGSQSVVIYSRAR